MRRPWPLALLLLGCGGGGSGDRGFIEGSVGTASVQFAGSADANNVAYNGNANPLTTLTGLDGSASSRVTTITATANDRAVEAVVVARGAKEGTIVDLADASTGSLSGSEVIYTDAQDRQYQAISGTITVQARTTSSVTLLLSNVVCEPVTTSSTAKGRVTLGGTLSFTGS